MSFLDTLNPLDIVTKTLDPLVKLVDNLHTSEEERLTIKQKLFTVQSDLTQSVMGYYVKIMDAQAAVITAEASGQSWIQRNWRPITMLTFLYLVVADSYAWLPNKLSDQAFVLLQIGLGGYVTGRSLEKIAPQITKIMRKD